MKISLAMVMGGGVKTETFTSFLSLLYQLKVEVHFNFYRHAYICEARNNMVREAIREGCTHILFIDNDMAFPADALNKLLSVNKPVVGANYYQKSLPLMSTVRFLRDGMLAFPDKIPQVPFQCFAVGMGLTLIDLSVFDKIKYPFFFHEMAGNDVMGEDVYFCKKVNEAGLEVWCEPSILIGHIGEYIYGSL